MSNDSIDYIVIESLSPVRLRNDEHFQFNTEIIRVITEFKPETLPVMKQFQTYTAFYRQEDEALKKIVKSIYTDDIHDQDSRRRDILRGMNDAIKAGLLHFNDDVRVAAKHIKVVVDTYGNVVKKPINEVTSSITNMLQDLTGRFADDILKAGIKDWVTELDKQNTVVSNLVDERYDESNHKSDIVMAKARRNTDVAYRDVKKRIEALCLITDTTNVYKDCIHKLNVIVMKYKNIIAQHEGRARAHKDNG